MLKGKSAVVTGATSGIGLVIAKALAAEGCNLVFNGLGDSQEIENLRRGIAEDFAVKSIYHGADLRKPEDIPALIEAAEEAFGRLDILINNAGIQHVSPIETFPSERWDAIIATHHQHRLGERPCRLYPQDGLRRRQTRHPRPDQSGDLGDRRVRYHLQRHLPRLCAHPFD